jgi:hypothetical protein
VSADDARAARWRIAFARAALDHAFPYGRKVSLSLERPSRLAFAYAAEARAGRTSLGEVLANVLAARALSLALTDGTDGEARRAIDVAFDRIVADPSGAYAVQSTAAGTIVSPITV